MKFKKKIGNKYCGGCNPNYERVEMIMRVQSIVEDRFSFVLHDQQDFDLLLVVNGCARACADQDLNRRKAPSRSIMGESDFENLISWLIGPEEKGERNETNRN